MRDFLHIWRTFCFSGTVVCVFLYIALCSFDISPWNLLRWRPEVVPFAFGVAGCCFLFGSGRWLGLLPRLWPLMVCVAIFLGWAFYVTWVASANHSPDVASFALKSLVKVWAIPFAFIVWSAMSFTLLPETRARRLFFAAMMILASLNAAHVLGELIANAGLTSVKSFLISINHYFRLEKIAHGWWPPVFWSGGRARGLFAEPLHMAFALLPALGLFLYKSLSNRLWLLAVAAWLSVMVVGKVTSGALCFCILVLLFYLPQMFRWARSHRRLGGMALVASLCLCLLGIVAAERKYRQIEPWVEAASSLRAYVRDAHAGKNPECPSLQVDLKASSLNTRLVTNGLDIDIGLANPLGVGFCLRGFYWQPLENCDLSKGGEIRGYVLQAKDDPARGIPHLNQYTAIFAEFGWPGLLLFCGMTGGLFLCCMARAVKYKDSYLWGLGCVFAVMCMDFMITSFFSSHMFFVFVGYLYSLVIRKPESPMA